MSLAQINPFDYFSDTNGDPLDQGYIYVGVANQDPVTNPIAIYYDAAMTIPAPQPLRTVAGYISNPIAPQTFFTNQNYSVSVRDKNQIVLFYVANFSSIVSGTPFALQLAASNAWIAAFQADTQAWAANYRATNEAWAAAFQANLIQRYLSFNNRGNWATGTGYAIQDIVIQGSIAYICLVAHTSGVFSTDLASGDWAVYQGVTKSDLAASTGADLVGFTQNLAGAILQTLKKKMYGYISPLDFMSTAMQNDVLSGALTMDHTAAVQLAINSGRNVDLCGLSYKVNNLTQTISNQSIISSQGIAKLIKNANGAILTSTASFNFRMQNISGFGDASTPVFTGDGFVATGNGTLFDNCGCRWMAGRALLSTGSHTQIQGTCDIYQTSDTSSTGYDIELGVSGKATLYHQIAGIYTTQATGGILATSCGTWGISGCQFGKLTIYNGGAPAGSSAPRVTNNRILGAIYTNASNGVFTCNQFSGATINVDVGAGSTVFDLSNVLQGGTTITNNTGSPVGVWSERIVTGSDATTRFAVQYGGDSSPAIVRFDPLDGSFCPDSHIRLKPQKNIYMRNAANTGDFNIIGINGSDMMTIGQSGLAGLNLQCGTGIMYIANSAGTQLAISTGVFRPFNDNNTTLGAASQRWSTVYAGTGAINTSDERLKQQWRSQSEAEKAAALEIKSSIGLYKFNDAVAEKGDGARWHVGVKAQQVVSIMQSHGLDALAYGFVCYDEWDEVAEIKSPAQEKVVSEDGATLQDVQPELVTQAYVAAGNRYGIRYDELAMFILSAI